MLLREIAEKRRSFNDGTRTLHVGPVDLSDFNLTEKEKSRLVEAEEAAKQETPNN